MAKPEDLDELWIPTRFEKQLAAEIFAIVRFNDGNESWEWTIYGPAASPAQAERDDPEGDLPGVPKWSRLATGWGESNREAAEEAQECWAKMSAPYTPGS